jgi:hypothetical protein
MPTAHLQAMVGPIDPGVKKVKGSTTGDALIEAAIKDLLSGKPCIAAAFYQRAGSADAL